MSTEQQRFYCYSTTLMHFLKANGLRYLYTALHERTGNRMWVFERDATLRSLLDEYDVRKAQARVEGRISNASPTLGA